MSDFQEILKIFEQNQIYFCEEYEDISTNSVKQMLKCFDIFYPYGTYAVFYRLKKKCRKLGYIDKRDLLVQPDKEYNHMVSLAILENPIDCPSWVEEEEFKDYLDNGQLLQLIKEICISSQLTQNINETEDNNNYVQTYTNEYELDSSDASEETSDSDILNNQYPKTNSIDIVLRDLDQQESPLYSYTNSNSNDSNTNSNSNDSNTNSNSNDNNDNNDSESDSQEIIEVVVEESSSEEHNLASEENFIAGYSDYSDSSDSNISD